jgi:thiosulfate dehydrogenase [quinone] large subunit
MQAKDDRNATALATLRIVMGVFFVLFGQYKVFGTDFTVHGDSSSGSGASWLKAPIPG